MKLLCGYQAQLLGFLRCVHPSPSGCAALPDVSSVIPILSLVRLRFRAWCDCVCGGGGADFTASLYRACTGLGRSGEGASGCVGS